MKKLLLALIFLGLSTFCDARKMTSLTVNNQTGIDWKVKIASIGKWISDWKPVSKNSSISFDFDAKTFTAQLRSMEKFIITAMPASKDIVLRKDFKNVSGNVSITIKENSNKTVVQGKYYIK